ncbi:S8 family peptidase [Lihuaxuella thermophila]|uniref:Subtilase family protein n=1 Tax=Lihuaxuella thermophila TaxID=1173111 RepID=A0A1H8ANB5_9BACL|nr:S8 family peptidase [Lihuaxuella thermophila]SEM72252.1 Subtilase family protein [Lihuaxuella thermophila]
MLSDWLLPSDNSWRRKKKRQRRIFYLREGIQLNRYLQVMRRCGVRPIRYLPHLGMIIAEYEKDFVSQSLESHPDIEYTEPDIRVTITEPYAGTIIPMKQLSLPWGVEMVEAAKAWPYTRGRAVRVAVIDTGISDNHPAIRGNYRGGVNILSPYFSPQDYNGHGTHVAGIIAGRASELGIMGVAPRAYIYAVKAFNRKGSANLSDLLSAINWCIDKKMHVINMSFGMEKMSESMRQAIQIAHRKGIIMVAATGNQGLSSQYDYPARYPETIAVTSISKNGQLSPFSNVGKGVDIAAPGEKIPSAWLNSSTREMSGTSMAVPHVTGTIALLLHLDKSLNPEQIRYILTQSSTKIRNLDGIGLLNAYQAVRFYQKLRR